MDYQKLTLEHLGLVGANVLKFTIYDDYVSLILDNGIKGCPKYTVALVDLQPAGVDVAELEADAPPEREVAQPEIAPPEREVVEQPLNATRAAEKLLRKHGSLDSAAAQFIGERVTLEMARLFVRGK